jgi:hypothetical protein
LNFFSEDTLIVVLDKFSRASLVSSSIKEIGIEGSYNLLKSISLFDENNGVGIAEGLEQSSKPVPLIYQFSN